MALWLKQSTASQEIPLGVFVDSTDGNTAETGLTIANTDIKVWKTGATTLADKNSGGATHIAGGIYYAVLDATDTDTLGPLVVFVHVAGALAVRVECLVLAANVYDSLVAASDTLQVETTSIAANAVSASAVAADAVTEIQSGLATAAALATVDTNVDSILADTGTDGVVVASIANGAITAAAIATNAIDDDALAADAVTAIQSGLATAAALATVDTNVDSILADTGTDGVVIAAATQNAIADATLARGVSNSEDTADAHSLTTVVLAALESSVSNTTWTIKKTDGATTFTTKTLTLDADASPITSVA